MRFLIITMLVMLTASGSFAEDKSDRSAEAKILTQKGIHHFVSLDDSDWPEAAVDYYDYAIAVDPDYGPAYAQLAIAMHAMWTFGRAPGEEAEKKAKWAVARAMELAPKLSTTYSADGLIKYKFDGDLDGALASFRKAIELDPKDSESYVEYAWALIHSGQFDAALKMANKALDLNPESRTVANVLGRTYQFRQDPENAIKAWSKLSTVSPNRYGEIAEAYLATQDYNQAIATAEQGLLLFPQNQWFKNITGRAYVQLGRYDQALAVFESTQNRLGRGVAYATMGRKEDALNLIDALKNGENKNQWWNNWDIAYILLKLGDKKQAMNLLEKAYGDIEPNPYMHYMFALQLETDPTYEILGSDKRFKALLKKTGYKK